MVHLEVFFYQKKQATITPALQGGSSGGSCSWVGTGVMAVPPPVGPGSFSTTFCVNVVLGAGRCAGLGGWAKKLLHPSLA